MRMARINVYLPDDLAAAAREQGLNVSALTQDAIKAQLSARATGRWLAGLRPPPGPRQATHDEVVAALDGMRQQAMGDHG
jgi:post-segregation antitoxin (ccd killing protein)